MTAPTATHKVVEFAQPQCQYPTFELLVDDLRRSYFLAHPEVSRDEVEFEVNVRRDGRSGHIHAYAHRNEGEWTINVHELVEIEDNRALRRVKTELPIKFYWMQ